MRAFSGRTLLAIALVALIAAAGVWWALPADPVETLRRYGAQLARVERSAAPELGERIERWRMITTTGDTLPALWRSAVSGTDHPWTVVLLGGLVAGERATLLVPGDAACHLLAVDWPWRESRHMPWWRVALRLGAVRKAVLRSPGVVALGVEAAARTPEVDPRRIALVGVSLGVPPAVSAIRLTPRPAALVLLHGAANLRELLRQGLMRERVPETFAGPLAAIAYRLIYPLEPALHAAAWGSRPVLIINAESDPFLPRASVERLHLLFPKAEMRGSGTLHGSSDRRAAVVEATRDVQAWLEALPQPR